MKTMKKAQLAWMASAILVAAGFLTGCSDSAVDPSTEEVTSSYMALAVNGSELDNYNELPTVEEALLAVSDSAGTDPSGRGRGHHGRGHGRGRDGGPGWHDRGNGRDFGKLGPLHLGHIVRRLNLTAEQDTAVRQFLTDFRSCATDAATPYKAARQAAFDLLKARVDAIVLEVRAGTMTNDAARAAIIAIRDGYRAEIEPLNVQFKAAVDACRATFDASFEAILTAEQLAIWVARKG